MLKDNGKGIFKSELPFGIYYEIAKTGKTHCNKCKLVINKDMMKMVYTEKNFRFMSKKYLCLGCAMIFTLKLSREIDEAVTIIQNKKAESLIKSDL